MAIISHERLLDQILVLRYLAGDDNAVEKLVERYQGPLRYFVRHLLGAAGGADDVLQDVWLTVIRKLRTLRSPASFSTWLYRVARNRTYQELRKKKQFIEMKESVALPDGFEDEDRFSPDDAARIHVCLGRLKAEHREVLMLRFLQNMPYEDIAEVTSCNPGTVKSRIYYAKRALRKQMEAIDDERREET